MADHDDLLEQQQQQQHVTTTTTHSLPLPSLEPATTTTVGLDDLSEAERQLLRTQRKQYRKYGIIMVVVVVMMIVIVVTIAVTAGGSKNQSNQASASGEDTTGIPVPSSPSPPITTTSTPVVTTTTTAAPTATASPTTIVEKEARTQVACTFLNLDQNITACRETTSYRFDVSTNTIPSEIGSLTQLTDFSLGGEGLNGTIPTELGQLTRLEYLGLWDNDLTGTIPTQLGRLTRLTALSFSSNEHLYGNIPSELGFLTQLTILQLQNINNHPQAPEGGGLYGTIPPSLCALSNNTLQIVIDCSPNITCTCCFDGANSSGSPYTTTCPATRR